MRTVFDMETRDPDDVLTLCLLAAHPAVDLTAVTITPGTREQVGVVRTILAKLDCEIPIGARAPDSPSDAVSQFHRDWLGNVPHSDADTVAHELIARRLEEDPATVLLTGAPLQNLGLLLRRHPQAQISRWVAQGGFAGDNLVPRANRLPKFAGRDASESFNFGGDKRAALEALASPRIFRRELVSKNVTHGVSWDAAFQTRMKRATGLTRGAMIVLEAMEIYLRAHPEGKFLHDPLAASAMLDPSSFTFAEVEMLYQAGRWGARAATGSATFITIGIDRERALAALLAPAVLPEMETRF